MRRWIALLILVVLACGRADAGFYKYQISDINFQNYGLMDNSYKVTAPTVNVLMYGADNTGVSSSTTAIINALTTGYDVVFPPGTYLTVGNHTPAAGQIIHLAGATVKRSSGTNPIFILANANSGIRGHGTLDGNGGDGAVLNINSASAVFVDAWPLNLKNVGGTAQAFTTTSCFNSTFEGMTFDNNYTHAYLNNAYYSTFKDTIFNAATGAGKLAVKTSTGGLTTIRFINTIVTDARFDFNNTGIRDIWFDGMRARLNSDNNTLMYASVSPGSEVAGMRLNNLSLYINVADNTNPIFDWSAWESSFDDIHIYKYLGTDWPVFKTTYAQQHLALNKIVVESTNAWRLFDNTAQATCTLCSADGIWYTQGVTGTATWYGNNWIVRNSNVAQRIGGTNDTRNYKFGNIQGTLDLTGIAGFGLVEAFNVTGAITDPTNALAFSTNAFGPASRGTLANTYDNNAAAVSGGLPSGTFYVGSDNVVRIVR